MFRHCFVVTQFLDHGDVMFHAHELDVTILDLSTPEPDIHNSEETTAHDQRNIAAMLKFLPHVGVQKRTLDREVNGKIEVDEDRLRPFRYEVISEKDGSSDHTQRDSEAIGRFHVG